MIEKENRAAYETLIHETIDKCFLDLYKLTKEVNKVKTNVYNSFPNALEMKKEWFEFDPQHRSHIFYK